MLSEPTVPSSVSGLLHDKHTHQRQFPLQSHRRGWRAGRMWAASAGCDQESGARCCGGCGPLNSGCPSLKQEIKKHQGCVTVIHSQTLCRQLENVKENLHQKTRFLLTHFSVSSCEFAQIHNSIDLMFSTPTATLIIMTKCSVIYYKAGWLTADKVEGWVCWGYGSLPESLNYSKFRKRVLTSVPLHCYLPGNYYFYCCDFSVLHHMFLSVSNLIMRFFEKLAVSMKWLILPLEMDPFSQIKVYWSHMNSFILFQVKEKLIHWATFKGMIQYVWSHIEIFLSASTVVRGVGWRSPFKFMSSTIVCTKWGNQPNSPWVISDWTRVAKRSHYLTTDKRIKNPPNTDHN